MNIIEREIAKRQEIVDGKDAKIAELAIKKAEVVALEEEIASINTENLVAEIAELKSFLPQEEVVEDEQPIEYEE